MKGKWISGFLILLCLLICGLSYYKLVTIKERNIDLQTENQKQRVALSDLKKELLRIQERLGLFESALVQYQGLSEAFRQQLIKKGHLDPESFILTALAKREDLIQSEAVLGGAFYVTAVKIVREGMAYAEFEDGHLQGFMLLIFSYHEAEDQLEVENIYEMLK